MVPRRLLAWRDAPGRLTRTHPAYAQERIVACKAAFLADGFLAGRRRLRPLGLRRHRPRAPRARSRRTASSPTHVVEVHPGRLGNRIAGAPVVAPERLATLPRGRLVASVAGAEARGLIRAF